MLKPYYIFLLLYLPLMLSAKPNTEVKIQLAEGNYKAVIHLCDSLLLENPKDIMAWQYKGMAQKALYQYNKALVSYKKAHEIYPESIALYYSLGHLQELVGDLEEAKTTYLEVILLDSTHISSKSRLATIYRSEKDYIKAMDLYTQLVTIDTTNAYFYSQLAYCCLKSGVNIPGLAYYEKAIELNPNDFKSKLALVSNLSFLKYYEDANYWIDTFLIDYPNNIKLLKKRAYLEAAGGNGLKAVEYYKELTVLGDSSLSTCKYYGQSLYNIKEYGKAAFWLSLFVDRKPDDAANHMILALAYQQDYQYEKSLEHFDETEFLKYDPILLARIYREKAQTYIKYGNYVGYRDSTQQRKKEFYQLAIDFYIKSESVNPAYVKVYYDLADFYKRHAKNPQLALYYYQKYYDTVDSRTLKDWELGNLQEYIEQLKEEVHFIGD